MHKCLTILCPVGRNFTFPPTVNITSPFYYYSTALYCLGGGGAAAPSTALKILEKRSRTLSVEIFFLLYSVEAQKFFRRQCAWTEFQNFESREPLVDEQLLQDE